MSVLEFEERFEHAWEEEVSNSSTNLWVRDRKKGSISSVYGLARTPEFFSHTHFRPRCQFRESFVPVALAAIISPPKIALYSKAAADGWNQDWIKFLRFRGQKSCRKSLVYKVYSVLLLGLFLFGNGIHILSLRYIFFCIWDPKTTSFRSIYDYIWCLKTIQYANKG